MVWACGLLPTSTLLSAVTFRPTEHAGKEPACPLVERKAGSLSKVPHEWVGARLAKCTQSALLANISQVPPGGRLCPRAG